MPSLNIIISLSNRNYKEKLTSIVEFSKELKKENPDMLIHIEAQVKG